jgi:hypothetical protein
MIELFFLIILLIGIIYLITDFRGSKEIFVYPCKVNGFSCLRARDLIVQDYDNDGNLWATRGMVIYKLRKGEDKFIKISHVPTGISVFWLRNFKF